jgi:myo-inositol-1(or 4)-monophosphatase
MTDLRGFLAETLDLAGAELLRRFGQSNNNVKLKKDTSLVTDADFSAEKIILDRIGKYFPNDSIISEEAGYLKVSRTPGQKVWIVDPLDGTTNYANGYPFFCTSIGYGEFQLDGKIKVNAGGIGDPTRQKKYLAIRGEGAHCNGKVMRVQSERPFDRCFLVTGFYYALGPELEREIQRDCKISQKCQSIRRDGSAALDLAFVAEGVFDCFWERGLGLWDVAAGSLLVQEAGGDLSNYPCQNKVSADPACLAESNSALIYSIEAEGIIAGTTTAVNEIKTLLAE